LYVSFLSSSLISRRCRDLVKTILLLKLCPKVNIIQCSWQKSELFKNVCICVTRVSVQRREPGATPRSCYAGCQTQTVPYTHKDIIRLTCRSHNILRNNKVGGFLG
jgi:hypothetical protein